MKPTESDWEIGYIDEVAQEVHVNTGPDRDIDVRGKWLSMAIFYGDEEKPEIGMRKAHANARLAIASRKFLTLSEQWLDDQLNDSEFADCLRAVIAKVRKEP